MPEWHGVDFVESVNWHSVSFELDTKDVYTAPFRMGQHPVLLNSTRDRQWLAITPTFVAFTDRLNLLWFYLIIDE